MKQKIEGMLEQLNLDTNPAGNNKLLSQYSLFNNQKKGKNDNKKEEKQNDDNEEEEKKSDGNNSDPNAHKFKH